MWTKEFPTTEGWYLFYGWDFGKKYMDDTPQLHAVKVRKTNNSFVYICDGHFIYKGEAIGMFHTISVPELPDEIEFIP